jgi:N6-adenosine-specific RNA methylase IME4
MRAHSQKPDEFYAFVEQLCPAPRYAELFSRRGSVGNWDAHGDEADAKAA